MWSRDRPESLSASYWDGTNQTYTYDAAGNRSSLVAGATTTSYSYDAAGRLKAAGSTTYGYDNDGNRTSATTGGVTTTYTYDQADRLIGVSGRATGAGTTYTYNGNGMRTAATNASTHATTSYQWDPLSGALLSDGTNEYVASASGGLIVQTPTAGGASAALFGVPDASGSTRVLINGSAQTQGTAAYDAFGVPKSSSGSATSPLGYTGQLTDSQTGLQYLRARSYDPATGQFTSQDSYAGNSGQPYSLNRYAYGANDPTTFNDPSGHDISFSGCLIGFCISASYGAGGASASISYNGQQLWSGSASMAQVLYFDANPGAAIGDAVSHAVTAAEQRLGLDPDQVNRAIGIAILVGLATIVLAPAVIAVVGAVGIEGAAATVLTGVLLGAFAGGASQVLANVMTGKQWNEGLLQATLLGAALGGLGAAIGGLFAPMVDSAASALADGVIGGADGEGVALEGAARDALDAAASDEADAEAAAAGGGCSFSADTKVATPSGEQAIASLHLGDTVLAYNPSTGKAEPELVQHVWVNHDNDLVDVGLQSSARSGPTVAQPSAPSSARRGKQLVAASLALAAALAISGHAGAPAAHAAHTALSQTATTETIHTTANHPWLTADRGWVEAGELRTGEPVVTLAGGTSTVAWVHVVPGQADYYNLTVAKDHTYAVGDAQVVVHNCSEEAQADLARMREEMGMSNPQQEDIDVANKVPGARRNTLGRMDFDGGRDSIYGQNGSLPRPYAYPGKGNGIAPQSFEDHAEGDMVSQAMSKGYSGGNATIYTDRVTCPWCQNSMAGYARLLKLDTLTVYGPDGLIGVWDQIGRVP